MTSAADDFNRANGGVGSNWTYLSGTAGEHEIDTNRAAIDTTTTGIARQMVFTGTLPATKNHSSALTLVSITSVNYNFYVRTSVAAGGGFLGQMGYGGSGVKILKLTGGSTFTELATAAQTWVANDRGMAEVEGEPPATIRVRRNGTQILSVTDSSFDDVKGWGWGGYQDAVRFVDDWAGEDLVTDTLMAQICM